MGGAMTMIIVAIVVAAAGGIVAGRGHRLSTMLVGWAVYFFGLLFALRSWLGGDAVDALPTFAVASALLAMSLFGCIVLVLADSAAEKRYARAEPEPSSAGPNYVPKSGGPVRPTWGRRRYASRAPASRYAGYRRAAPRGG